MRIDKLTVTNFKGFVERELVFSPQFNLIVGNNGTGKTSVLDALEVALGAWHYGYKAKNSDKREINSSEIRLQKFDKGGSIQLEPQYPVKIQSIGSVMGEVGDWTREKRGEGEKTIIHGKPFFYNLVGNTCNRVRNGEDISIPLIACYGSGRLWLNPTEELKQEHDDFSRLSAYKDCYKTRISAPKLNEWIYIEEQKAFRENKTIDEGGKVLKKAILACLDQSKRLWYDVQFKQIVVEFEDGHAVPYSSLSDGQRTMFTLIGDIARRAITLNPQLGESALLETYGVVVIDELDLHLHPKWQRRVIEDLRRTFPKIQFIATTHSPFLIQTLRPGELIMLDGEPTDEYSNLGVEAIAAGIMGVKDPEASPRYMAMLNNARAYLAELDEAAKAPEERLAEYERQLAAHIAPYADNPAFQAVLEAEKKYKLGN